MTQLRNCLQEQRYWSHSHLQQPYMGERRNSSSSRSESSMYMCTFCHTHSISFWFSCRNSEPRLCRYAFAPCPWDPNVKINVAGHGENIPSELLPGTLYTCDTYVRRARWHTWNDLRVDGWQVDMMSSFWRHGNLIVLVTSLLGQDRASSSRTKYQADENRYVVMLS